MLCYKGAPELKVLKYREVKTASRRRREGRGMVEREDGLEVLARVSLVPKGLTLR